LDFNIEQFTNKLGTCAITHIHIDVCINRRGVERTSWFITENILCSKQQCGAVISSDINPGKTETYLKYI
jgi:hypothetical protein